MKSVQLYDKKGNILIKVYQRVKGKDKKFVHEALILDTIVWGGLKIVTDDDKLIKFYPKRR